MFSPFSLCFSSPFIIDIYIYIKLLVGTSVNHFNKMIIYYVLNFFLLFFFFLNKYVHSYQSKLVINKLNFRHIRVCIIITTCDSAKCVVKSCLITKFHTFQLFYLLFFLNQRFQPNLTLLELKFLTNLTTLRSIAVYIFLNK